MSEKQQYKELKKNTILIGISNLGSKAIGFVLAPLYSYYLSTSEYGTMDLITTTAGLLLPILCLDIYEATFRFASDKEHNDKTVFSSSFTLTALMAFIVLALIGILNVFVTVPVVVSFSVISAAIDAIYMVLSQFARGQNKMKVFAFSGVVNSIFLLGSNAVLLFILRYGLYGWMTSYIVGKIIACVYIVWSGKSFSFFSIKAISKDFYNEALKYSLPLLPTAMMWWVMNASDRYMIAFFMGTAANGIYAVANKMPSFLSVFENVFYQAWQTSSINAIEDKNRDKFYSEVFKKYFSVLALGVLGLLLILKPMTLKLFAHGYEDAWLSTSILVIAVMFHALSGNLGTLYVTFKNTKGALVTSTIGAVTNTVLNWFLIPHGGLIAAATTTLIGYIIVLLYRWWDVKKFVKLTIKPSFVASWLAVICIQFGLYYVDGICSYAIRLVIVLVAMWVNREIIVKIVKR